MPASDQLKDMEYIKTRAKEVGMSLKEESASVASAILAMALGTLLHGMMKDCPPDEQPETVTQIRDGCRDYVIHYELYVKALHD